MRSRCRWRSVSTQRWARLGRTRSRLAVTARFSAGDEVFGIGQGAFAEYAAAWEYKLARQPANATFEQAAVVPVSALTAR